MGRTFRNYKEEEDNSYSKTKRYSKHSRNQPGKGMRILNEYEEDSYDDYDDIINNEYDDNTAQYYDTRRK